MKKNIKIIFVIFIVSFFFISNQNSSSIIEKTVSLSSIFTLEFETNSWIIQSLDKDFLLLVSKDISSDTVIFHFKPKKTGQTKLVFYNLLKKGTRSFNITISENLNFPAGFSTNYTNQTETTVEPSYFDIAFYLFANGMYDDAITYFIKGKELDSESYARLGEQRVCYYLGICYFNKQQYPVASTYFAISKSSDNKEIKYYSYYYMAKTQLALGNNDLAKDNLLFLIYQLNKEDSLYDNAYFLLSSIYFDEKKYEYIITLLLSRYEIFSKSIFLDYFSYYLAIAYYAGRNDYNNSYYYLCKITSSDFEFYKNAMDLKKLIETNFIDFH
ncbi:MAG TPA: hypothetical protein PK520_07620 [Exilispira sp.]|nr:hypothetical protein [Exilispira sp.]HPB47478.1 hypothetical protein [Exilispira sp.]HQM89527.1 hypothetical protein [Exilispira sp.]HQQ19942.1 hypothetical protein [Exilispira sp.]